MANSLLKRDSIEGRNRFLLQKMTSSLASMHEETMELRWGETTSFHRSPPGSGAGVSMAARSSATNGSKWPSTSQHGGRKKLNSLTHSHGFIDKSSIKLVHKRTRELSVQVICFVLFCLC